MSLEDDHNKLKEEHEKLKKQYADVMGDGGSYRRLQVGLDAALQKHKDDAAAHERVIVAQKQQHEADTQALKARTEASIADLQQDHAAKIESMKKEHAASIAELKEKILGPALRAEHARRAAELAAKQEAELKAL